MCKICKTCGQSNFGVIVKRIEKKAAKMLDGKITEYFEEYEEIAEETEINYCFTCSREVAEEDLTEVHICKACKSEVYEVNENGICVECMKEAEKLAEISKEELILMILKQNKKIEDEQNKFLEASETGDSQKKNKIFEENQGELENKKEKIAEKLVKNNRKSDTIKKENKSANFCCKQEVEIDVKNRVFSKRKNGHKASNKAESIQEKDEGEVLNFEKNIENAIKANKEKVKLAAEASSLNTKSLNNVKKEVNNIFENDFIGIGNEVNDVAIIDDICEDMDISNINKEIAYKDVVNNTLMEIEDIIRSMDSQSSDVIKEKCAIIGASHDFL